MDTIPDPHSDSGKVIFRRIAELQVFFLACIFLILFFYALYLTRVICIPFVIALLFNFLLAPSVKFLKRIYIPAQIGSALVILLLLLIISSFFYGLAQPAATWLNKGPTAIIDVNQKLTTLAKSFSAPFNNLSKFGEGVPLFSQKPIPNNQKITTTKEDYVIGTVVFTSEFLAEFGTTIILLYFFLSYDHYFVRKILHWLTDWERKKEVVVISHEIQSQIFKYLFARTFINVGLAIAVSILMLITGMPNPILWGVLTGFLEFIPYLGALISMIIITIIALFTFVSIGYAFLVAFVFFVAVFIEANIVCPIVFGRTFTLNPIIVFLSLMFFTWIWGIAGAFVAVPMLVMIKIIGETLYV